MNRTLDGDTAAFGTLVERYTAAVHAIALAHLRDPDDAEDLAQEVLVRAYSRLHQCHRPAAFAGWIARMTRNLALNRLDSLARRPTRPITEDDVITAGSDPESDLHTRRTRARLRNALAHLKPVQREALLLHDLDQLDHREIAALLGISTFMSRRHVSDARKRMRLILGEDS